MLIPASFVLMCEHVVHMSSPKWLKSFGGSHLHEEACLDLLLYHLCRRLKPLLYSYLTSTLANKTNKANFVLRRAQLL